MDHPQYAHPFYWSSLVITGDGAQPMVAEPVRAPIGLHVLALALALAAVVIAGHRVLTKTLPASPEAQLPRH